MFRTRRIPAPARRVVEVCVHWGARCLAVEQLSPGEALSIGGSRWPMPDGSSLRVQVREEQGSLTLVIDGPPERSGAVVLPDSGGMHRRTEGPFEVTARAVPRPPRIRRRIEDFDFRFPKLMIITGMAAVALGFVFLFSADVLKGAAEVPPRWAHRSVAAALPRVHPRVLPMLRMTTHGAQPRAGAGPLLRARPGGGSERGGLVEALQQLGGGGGNIFGPGLGTAINTALGELRAGGAAEQAGPGWGGSRGNGAGPGTGGLSMGDGIGIAGGDGPGLIPLRGPERAGTSGPPPPPLELVGGLPPEVVRRVVRRHASQIKHCYDVALQQDPRLAGKVTVMFTIDPQGAVAQAAIAESTLESQGVETCIVERIGHWRFPEPVGGGVVEVSLPWVFHAAGEVE